jgi:hypothetical protein
MMRASARRKWKSDDEPSPREKREMMQRGEWDEDSEKTVSTKAPVLFRLIAWLSLIVIFFSIGYGATSMLFKWMDSKSYVKSPANLVSTPQDAENLLNAAKSEDETAAPPDFKTYTLSIPEGTSFVTRQIRCPDGIREDIMQQTLSAYLDAVKESKMLDPMAASLNIFQSGEWLYINVNQSFMESIKNLGTEKATYLLTGLVKTMSVNFSPINRIKFYVDGKEIRDKKPVDLTLPWGVKGG